MKLCRCCGLEKSADQFSQKRKESKDGLQSWCKECVKANVRKWGRTDAGRAYSAERSARRCADCHPNYIKLLLAREAGCSMADVPRELVAAKRSHIMVMRAIKDRK